MKKYVLAFIVLFFAVIFFIARERIVHVCFFIASALLMTYLALPFVNALSRRLPRGVSIFLFYFLSFGAVALLVFFILPSLADGIRALSSALPRLTERLSSVFPAFSLENLSHYLSGQSDSIFRFLSDMTAFLSDAVLAVVLSCFFLIDYASLSETVKGLVPASLREKLLPAVREIDAVFRAFFRSQFLISALIALGSFFILFFLRVPYALPLSMLYGLSCLLPTVGPILGAVPIIVIAYLKSPLDALIAGIFLILLQILDNTVLSPKIKADSVDISSASAFLALYLGGYFFGLFGIVLGIPVFSSLKIILRRLLSAIA